MKAALLVLAVGCGGWGKADTALELAGQTANGLDWRQSETITQQDNESNPIIGQHGNHVPLDVYCGSVMVLHFAVSALLPQGKWRTAWQGLSAGVEGFVVYNNYKLGYR